jgi:hypothetical protein
MRRPSVADNDCPIDLALALELWLGGGDSSFFTDREELRQTWEVARAYMLKTFGRPGRRPMAWWEFDAGARGLHYPGYDREIAYLWAAGVLDAEECAELEITWRREYERALETGFSLTVNPEVILTGARARRAHWQWAGIPHTLLEQWQSERRRPRRRRKVSLSEVDSKSASASDSA